ncbi:MAG: ATP-binding domain-containing protein, partial [Oscillospiraceae bacterium]|nr:ATP-binding domain-containing protein [Oscillospiraceae bacterium]
DDDQSIYRFRGATIKNILEFEQNFHNAKVIRLEQNYRSSQTILDAANSVIANNTERKGKQLWTSNPKGEPITHKITFDEQSEAKYIADAITDSAAEGKNWGDHVVLYRMNAQSNNIERALVRAGIPYRLIGGHRFYDRKEIKDALAYLCVIVNPADDVRLRRIINEPKRGIGESTLTHVARIAGGMGVSMFEIIRHADEYEILSRAAGKLKLFASMILGFIERSESVPAHELLRAVLHESGYLDALAQDIESYEDRVANLDELASNLVRFFNETPDAGLQEFLEDVALMSDIDNYNADTDTVILMTLHSAKGLEFPVCFIAGMEEGVFPGMQSIYNPGDIEEERRLAYVGITRAKEKLYLLSAGNRMLYGSTTHNRPSRFAGEIPEGLKDEDNDLKFSSGTYTTPFGGQKYSENQRLPSEPQLFQKQNAKPPAKPAGFGAFGATQKKEAPLDSYKPGDAVIHKKFGPGVIISCEAMGNDMLLQVAFEQTGTKKLMARAARLEKL